MRLRVTIDDRGNQRRRDVTLAADPDIAADQAIYAISTVAAVAEPLWDEYREIPVDVALSETGLRDGSLVGVGGPVGAVRDSVDHGIELRVIGGTGAGLVFRLRQGRFVLGRQATCAIPVPDPEMSREHAAVEISPEGAVTICDLGSSNGTSLEGAGVGTSPVPLAYGQVVQLGGTFVTVCPVDPRDGVLTDDGQCGYVFNRRYRIRRPASTAEIEFPNAPQEEEKAGFPWLMMGAPLVLAVGMAAVLKQPEYLMLAVMSPVMTLGSTVHDRQTRKRRSGKANADFETKAAEAERQAQEAVQEERTRRRSEAPDPATLVLSALGPRGRLWERRADDDDQLNLRLGLATQPSVVRMVNHPSPPPAWAVPVSVPLPTVGVLGVAAEQTVARSVARGLLLQAAVLHGPEDVRVVLLTESAAESEWDWVRWLPHTQLDANRGIVSIGNDPETLASRIKELQQSITTRLADRRPGTSAPGPPTPRIVVVIDGAKRLRSLPGMLSVLRDGPATGIYCVCLDDDRSLLPEECGAVVAWDDGAGRATVEQHGMPSVGDVALDRPAVLLCEMSARAMAPIHRLGDEAGGSVPTAARLAELTGMDPPSPALILDKWSAPGRGPRALLGVAEHGPLVLDLATDGPHGLVAGTTGAGKSELLQSLVAGLATTSPPDELNVVLVDYKGGAAFRDCQALPHTVGMVTDLDAHLTERALRSLQAELKRREQVLAAAGTKDIGDYVETRTSGRKDLAPLPRLVIVMDEFASLAVELPDFIKGLVGIAQRGRSLGVHLVLATQRPTGVVSPEIRANANFSIALRVVSGAESSDVIGVPDAASISPATPGRAYLRISQEPPVCFQTARVGGRRPGIVETPAAVTAFDVPWNSLGTPDPPPPSPSVPADDATDLHDLVAAIIGAAEKRSVPTQRQPWLDPLPEILTLDQLASRSARTEPSPAAADVLPQPFGLRDLPDLQVQEPACFDPAAGRHLMVAGSPRSGRTTCLRSVAVALATACAVDDVHLYAVDCGNGGLLPLREFPHCGAVVTRNESDRCERLLGRLADEVHRRQSELVERGQASAAEQRSQSGADERWPYMVILVDAWEGFLDAFHEHKDGAVENQLLNLLRDGAPVGLTVVMTGDRSLLSSARVSSLFEDRYVLRFNDRDDYSLAALAPRKMPESVPAGRAFRVVTGDELQVALPVDDPSGPAQATALAELAKAAREIASARPPGVRPIRVDPLPTRVSVADVARLERASASASTKGAPQRSRLAVMGGVGGDELAPWWVDLSEVGPGFVVTGSPGSGRSTALLTMGSALADQGCSVVAVAPRPSPLQALAEHDGAVVLEGQHARALETEGPSALEALGAGAIGATGERPLVVLVDDAEQLDPDDGWLTALASSPAGQCAVIVAGTVEPLRDVFRGFPLHAKRSGSGLLLSPKHHLDAGVFNATLPRGAGFAGPPGRAYLFLRGRPTALVQLPLLVIRR